MSHPHRTPGRLAIGRAAVLPISFTAILALCGGASRADAASQPIVQTAAVIVIGVVLATRGEAAAWRAFRLASWFLATLAALILIQLVPLPPSLWLSLAGRAPYAEAVAALGEAQPWRPLNLTPDLGWDALLALLPAAAVLASLMVATRTERQLPIWLLLVVAVTSALLGLAQMAGGADSALRFYRVTSLGSPTGLFANRNHQAMLLACAIPAAALLATQTSDGRPAARLRLGAGGAIVFLFTVLLVASGSRAGIALGGLALVISLLFWHRAFRFQSGKGWRRRPVLIAAGTATTAVALFAYALLSSGRMQSLDRLMTTSAGEDMRIAWLKPAGEALSTFFPWGSGFGSFEPVFRRFETFDILRFDHANHLHNDPFQVAIEAGLPGIALIAAYLIWWLRRGWEIRRSPAGENRDLATLGMAITVLLILGSIFDYPLRTPLLSGLFMLASLWMLAPAPGPATSLEDTAQE